ncbi:MAG: tetratricopeptide repeat protein [Vicinamibacterales bacterium]
MRVAPFSAAALLVAMLLASQAAAQPSRDVSTPPPNPATALDRTVAAAEAALRVGELHIAESRYRDLLLEAWLVLGELHVAAGKLDEARNAFRRASASAVDAAPAFHALALVHLRMGQAGEAVALLTRLATEDRRNIQTRRLLAQALVAAGEPKEAVQTLEEARAVAPDDPELAFALATGYLHLKKVEAADLLFARVVTARPIPQTYLLIGRTYRDFGLYDRARAAFEQALHLDPRIPRAHYYLGTLAVMSEGILRLDDAIREFREERRIAPADPLTNLRLGMALVEARRPAEALGPLEAAAGVPSAPADAFLYLGRCQLALDRPEAAVASLRRALERSRPEDIRIRHIHYQLALALRRSGAATEAAAHFEQAEQASARRADADREQLARYLTDTDARPGESLRMLPPELPFAALSPAERTALAGRATTALARAYQNLGVMQAQAQRFVRAAELFTMAADVAPEFPQVQYSLGVAYFNAEQHQQAVAPLERALAAEPGHADTRRMLALALLNSDQYARAASLLAADPRRESDSSLQYAYGVALVRSDRAADAEAEFERLLAAHGATPELKVVLGQAHAQQGDYDSAISELQGALALRPDVSEANATLGLIYLKQGKLADARTALRAELQAHPGDVKAAHTLATVLDLEGDRQQAIRLLRSVLSARPDFADARYLLGKILLAGGAAAEAADQLEAAVRLAPDAANIHYQLAHAYLKLGRAGLADRHFEIYRQIKDKRRAR